MPSLSTPILVTLSIVFLFLASTATAGTFQVAVTRNYLSNNCTGTSRLIPYTKVGDHPPCVKGNGLSEEFFCKDGQLGSSVYAGSDTCALSSFGTMYSESIGRCHMNYDNTSYVTWCTNEDANTREIAAVPLAAELPAPSDINVSCGYNASSTCGDNLATLYYASASDCNESITVTRHGGSPYALTLDTCFTTRNPGRPYDLPYNIQASCSEDMFYVVTSTGGCGPNAFHLSTTATVLNKCIQIDIYTWLRVHCPRVSDPSTFQPYYYSSYESPTASGPSSTPSSPETPSSRPSAPGASTAVPSGQSSPDSSEPVSSPNNASLRVIPPIIALMALILIVLLL